MNDLAEIGSQVTQLVVAFLLALPIARDRMVIRQQLAHSCKYRRLHARDSHQL